MVTPELIDYVKTHKQQNVTDEVIRESLLKSNWPIADITQAFLQVNTPPIPQTPTTSQSSPAVSSQQVISSPNKVNPSTEEKPKIIKTISALIFLIASLYILSTVSMLGIIVIMEHSMGAADLVFSFLKYFPTFGIIPIMFSFVTFFFFYLAFKIRNGSKFSLWLAVSSLLIIPTLAAIFSQIIISPIVKLVAGYDSSVKSIPSSYLSLSNLRFGDPIFVLAVISLVLIAISFKRFHFHNDPISNKAKVFLALVAFILIIPSVSVVSLDYVKSQDTDYGYTKAKTAAGYHIYKPSPVPNGLTYASKFILGKELAGKQTAVQVAYDIPFDELMRNGQSRLIVVKQVEVETGFNLDAFASTFVKDASLQKITLSKAVNQTGYLLQKKLGNSELNAIAYLTNDSVLITLMSPKATSEELIEFAESLE